MKSGRKKGCIPWNKNKAFGLYGTAFYRAWVNMKTRCTNRKTTDYINYGGRGIIICDEWKNFEGFYKDMYLTYKVGLTLDRVNNNGNYSKENCRWVDRKIQASNRRSNRLLNFNGVEKTLTEWANFLKIKRSTLAQRYYVYNWSIEKCLK